MKRVPSSCSILIFFLALFVAIAASSEESPPSIYDVLSSHGLPIGLLPKGVTEFSLDESGRFEVHLQQPCNAKFENEVHYERNVSGFLSYGRIGALSGISAQELFLWFPVKGIRVDIPSSGLIYFDVGVIYKQFSLSLFETPPNCKAVDSDLLLSESRVIATTVSKSQSRKFRYEIDQGDIKNAVL
ncbi:hypothetical protein NE237_013397 [Protea cynaroides]|uniref:Uncharacterized protein n=1 Tax=Protea cynaroides TaxID=273540 RepID=A0A9Q0JXU1_9MAGN|nr:hypothetical protein NE237_013397 [Protea cynaroides]